MTNLAQIVKAADSLRRISGDNRVFDFYVDLCFIKHPLCTKISTTLYNGGKICIFNTYNCIEATIDE